MTNRRAGCYGAIAALVTGWLAMTPARVIADTYPRQPGLSIAHYTFDVTLSDANDEFLVKETVNVRFLAGGVTTVDLDLCKFTAQPRAPLTAGQPRDPCAEPSGGRGGTGAAPVGGKGMIVTAVASDGRALTFQHENDRLRVTLPRAFPAGDHCEITLSYHGVPATGILIARNKYGDREFVSNPWPNKARNYLASIDHPSAKAPVTTIVTAPRHYQVIANGRLTEEIDLPDNLRRTAWSESSPICTCLMSLGVAPFAVVHFGEYHGIPLSAWVYPQERDAGVAAFRAWTQPILEFFIDRIGPYSYEKLAQVQANGIGGGMELASDIFYGYPPTGPGRQLIAHEMAHQWFGDSAAEKDWDDVWLSEGFATYFALLYQEFEDGHDAFLDGIKRGKSQAIAFALANPASTIVHDNLADISRVIANNAQIYQGGAQVLQNIRGVIGTDTFWAGIRLYYTRFQNGNATTDELRHAMEEACATAGDRCPAEGRDLGWLFRELLNRGGVLQVRGSWSYDAAAKQVEVTLDQTQTSGLYQMPIEVGITLGRTPVPAIQVAQLRRQHEVFIFPSDTEPLSVVLDPNAWVMMQATFEKKPPEP
jgi:aminopeptidase N